MANRIIQTLGGTMMATGILTPLAVIGLAVAGIDLPAGSQFEIGTIATSCWIFGFPVLAYGSR